MNSIFEQINNLKKTGTEVEEKTIDIAGDGYLVIGVKANDGIPELPPKGLPVNELDTIRQEIVDHIKHQ